MSERYGELKLYFGYVADAGRGEGRFEREPKERWSKLAVNQAIDVINRYLQRGWEWGLHIGWIDDGVASSEEEALSLITHAKTHFENAHGLVVPFDRMHGSTRFIVLLDLQEQRRIKQMRLFLL